MEENDAKHKTIGFDTLLNASANPHKKGLVSTWLKWGGKSLLSTILMGVVIWKARDSLSALQTPLHSLRVFQIAAGGLLFLSLIFIKALRWHKIISHLGYNLSIRDSFLSYLGGIAFGAITPGRVGEFTRVYSARAQAGLPLGVGLVSVIADRGFDMFVLLVLGLCGIVSLLFPSISSWLIFFGAGICVMGFVAAYATAMLASWAESKTQGKKKARMIAIFRQAVGFIQPTRFSLWLYTLAAYGIYFFASFKAARIAGVSIDFLPFCAVVACAGLIVLLPVSIAGLGTREMVFVTMLGRMGVPDGVALAASLLHFSLFFVLGSCVSAVAIPFLPAGFSQNKPRPQDKSFVLDGTEEP